MKKIILTFVATSITLFGWGQESEISAYKNEFHLSLIHPVFHEFKVGYERHVNNHFSILISPSFVYENSEDPRIGGAIQLEPRFYFKPMDFVRRSGNQGGIYWSPFVKVKYLESDNQTDVWFTTDSSKKKNDTKIYSYGGGIVFGFKTMFFNKLVIDINLGAMAREAKIEPDDYKKYNENYFDTGFSGVGPYGNFSLGFLF